ncbi:hypothetical protein [Streptobacillus moniliformis]|uniref:hypothetical protein n=1 Tax=Streptobacillus moniliformis TaxID=34105 RepID=UPI0007E426C2|nr:hypothetical protein [Streptobacillus moniliformis]
MIRIFLKDIFDKKIIFRYISFSVFLFFLINTFLREFKYLGEFSVKNSVIYIMVGLFFSIYFFVRTYIKNDRIMPYYALPVSRVKINESFIISVFFDTFFRKILILIAFMLNFDIESIFYVNLFLLLPSIIILSFIGNVTNISKINKFITLSISIVYIFIILILSFYTNLMMTFILGLCICFFYYVFVRKYFIAHAFFKINISNKLSKFSLNNYFLKFFLAENVYIINSVGILIMVVVVGLFSPKEISLPLSCAIGTINTPLLTIFSTEKELENMNNFFPNKFRSLNRDYVFLILSYFFMVKVIILIINLKDISIRMLIHLFLILIVEVYFSYMLEKKIPIKNKKTTMQIWKNPRKYILTLIILLTSAIFQYFI